MLSHLFVTAFSPQNTIIKNVGVYYARCRNLTGISCFQPGKRPITDAAVEISSAGEPDKILEVLKTDLSGQTEVIELETPPLEYSMEPGLNQPYSEYNLKITAPGFEPVEIAGSQMLSGQLALQNLSLEPTITETASYEVLAIGPHTLYGDYPPKSQRARLRIFRQQERLY